MNTNPTPSPASDSCTSIPIGGYDEPFLFHSGASACHEQTSSFSMLTHLESIWRRKTYYFSVEGFMGKIRPIFYVILFLGLGFAPRAYAHHGYAAYDMSKTITVNGTVTEMQMDNPHSSLTFDVKDEKGDVTKWA